MQSQLRFISIKEACMRSCLGKTTLLKWEAEGSFPKAVRLSKSKRVWLESDINDWILSKRSEITQIGLEAYSA